MITFISHTFPYSFSFTYFHILTIISKNFQIKFLFNKKLWEKGTRIVEMLKCYSCLVVFLLLYKTIYNIFVYIFVYKVFIILFVFFVSFSKKFIIKRNETKCANFNFKQIDKSTYFSLFLIFFSNIVNPVEQQHLMLCFL